MYAARMLGIEAAEQIVPFLVDALESTDPQVRREAVRALGEIKDPAALDGLSAALGDDDEETREVAARSLGLLNVPGVVPALAGALSGPRPWSVPLRRRHCGGWLHPCPSKIRALTLGSQCCGRCCLPYRLWSQLCRTMMKMSG